MRRIPFKWPLFILLASAALLGLLCALLGPGRTELRIIVILLALLGWTALLAFTPLGGRLGFNRSSQPPLPPELKPTKERGQLAMMRGQIQEAIQTIRNAHGGGGRGKAALYELPWFLLLGPKGAGKSRMVQHSGLTFPIPPQADPCREGQDCRPTCDWHFSTEGILLDADGRFCEETDDHGDWLDLMGLLKARRSRKPLDGMVLVFGLDELLAPGGPALRSRARLARKRIAQAERIFGARIPVHLVFTKADRLEGFMAFFQGLEEKDRRQPWGTSLPLEQPAGFPYPQAVREGFQEMVQGLTAMGARQLAEPRPGADRTSFHAFPVEFRELEAALLNVTGYLSDKDPFHAPPLLRGFHFVSSLPEAPAPSILRSRVAGLFQVEPPPFQSPPPQDPDPLFLESLFQEVVFPDLDLTRQLGSRRPTPRRTLWVAAGLLGLAFLCGAWTWAYIGNQKLIQETGRELREARRLHDGGQFHGRMQALRVLQGRLEQLGGHRREGPPLGLRWGLYQGGRLEGAVRSHYWPWVRQTMLAPVKAHLESFLQGPSGSPAPERYAALKTYLMLNRRDRLEDAHLADQLPWAWRPWLSRQGGEEAARDPHGLAAGTVAYYVSQIKAPDLPLIDVDQACVDRARMRLRGEARRLSPLEQVHGELKSRANSRFEPLTLAAMLKDKDPGCLRAGSSIPGCFTRQAWEGYIREAILQVGRGEFHGTDWVLESGSLKPAGSPESIRMQLEVLYKLDYVKAWDQFLQGLSLPPLPDPQSAIQVLDRLSHPQESPLKHLLLRVAQETGWDSPSSLGRQLSSVKAVVRQTTEKVLGTRPGGEESGTFSLASTYAGVARLVQGDGGEGAPGLGTYLDVLQKVRNRLGAVAAAPDPGGASLLLLQGTLAGTGSELSEGLQQVEQRILFRLDDHSRTALRPLLLRPLGACCACLLPLAEQEVNRAWAHQVYAPWSNLADKYPFAESENEAPFQELTRFLQPGEGTLDRFLEHTLGPLVSRQGENLVPRDWGGQGIRFSPAFLQGTARLLQAGRVLQNGDVAHFELQPLPTPGLSETSLEIDGQRLVYRNGPQAWVPFRWPSPDSQQGARLQAITFQGTLSQVHVSRGRLGFMRLLDRCSISAAGVLEWKDALVPAPGIRFNFRTVGGPNPLQFGIFRQHTLPARIAG